MKTDILIIGGSAAGLVAAMTAKSNFPGKDVTIIRKEEKVMIPCGIPYIFGTLGATDKNILPDAGLEKLGVNILIDEVISVDTDAKTCKTKAGKEISYEKLIFGTGSLPFVPASIIGQDLKNVFTVPKNKVYLDAVLEKMSEFKKIVVVGAGFIGVEFSDEFNKKDIDVTLVEVLPKIMGTAFDPEFSDFAEEDLKARGVKVLTSTMVKEIKGDDKVSSVLLGDGTVLEADAVILSIGYKPNTKLAKDSGLELNEAGFIKVDRYLRTAVKDVYAAGDCAEKHDFATGKISKIMLASTACAEARVAALNLYKLSTTNIFRGTIGIYSTSIGDMSYAVAGLTEGVARSEEFDYVTGTFAGIDRHPGSLTDTSKQIVKLIVQRCSGVILGGSVYGGKSGGELINVIGFAIQGRMTLNDLLVAQIGTQPMLTASPAAYPLIKAAEVCAKQMKN
ncbi:MAG: FAD-dependent oxidoreductase [Candidatus Marinimicrobia bacterium]|nr:FAD-dependent oxidoreductase [Candidatus Neomarinimicrobiota bacterium]